MQKIVTRWKQKDKGGLNETRYDVFMALSHVVWNLYSYDWPAHAEAFRRRKNIKFLCARLLMTDLQIRKRWVCVQLLLFKKDTLYYLQSISNATTLSSGCYNLGIQVSCENSNFPILYKSYQNNISQWPNINAKRWEKVTPFTKNTSSYTCSLVTVCKIILHKVSLTVVAMFDIIVRI